MLILRRNIIYADVALADKLSQEMMTNIDAFRLLSSTPGSSRVASTLVVLEDRKTGHSLTEYHETPNLPQEQQLFHCVARSNLLCFRRRMGHTFLRPGKPIHPCTPTHSCSAWHRPPVGCLTHVVFVGKNLLRNTPECRQST